MGRRRGCGAGCRGVGRGCGEAFLGGGVSFFLFLF